MFVGLGDDSYNRSSIYQYWSGQKVLFQERPNPSKYFGFV